MVNNNRKESRRCISEDYMDRGNCALLTEKEASDYFGWSQWQMREIRKRGEIDYIRFNDQTIRYSLEMLEAYQRRFLQPAADTAVAS